MAKIYLGAGSGVTKVLLHLEGNSNDSSGNGNNGTDTSILYTLVDGMIGQSANFNGSTSKIQIGVKLFPTSAFTVIVRIRTNSTNRQVIVGESNDSSVRNGVDLLTSVDAGNHNVRFQANKGTSGTPNFSIVATKETIDNKPHVLIGTWDGTTNANGAKLYIDGDLIGSATALTASQPAGSDNTRIGMMSNSTLEPFAGNIDELIIEAGEWKISKIRKYVAWAKNRYAPVMM